jgi:hypothetical protein
LITAADAQVSIGVGRDGPSIRLGPDDDRGMARAQHRGRHYGPGYGDGCREVTVTKRLPDGSKSVRTTRRCD